MSVPLEHDYIAFSSQSADKSSMEKTGDINVINTTHKTTKPISALSLNLKATELRLGLPGSESPERDNGSPELCIGVPSCKSSVSRPKRGFSVAIHGGSGNWVFSSGRGGSDTNFSSPRSPAAGNSEPGQAPQDGGLPPQSLPAQQPAPEKKKTQAATGPASKAQVVGWPPIRSFRKITMASHPTPKNSDVAEGGDHHPQSGGSSSSSVSLYVKVSMDGAPYLRKVDLKTHGGYKDLSLALENMFSCFTIGQCGSHGVAGKDGVSESRLVDILHGSEYVLTYEDKDGDWMLVGDVPWKMFIDSCRRLRIMKSSDAIGLAPRAFEKCKSSNLMTA